MKKTLLIVSLGIILSLLLASCGAVQSVVDQYHTLIEKYQTAQKQVANFKLCVDTAMGTIYTQATFLQSYQQADVEKARVWREALDQSAARLVETLANYRDANGNAIPAENLDLSVLADAEIGRAHV